MRKIYSIKLLLSVLLLAIGCNAWGATTDIALSREWKKTSFSDLSVGDVVIIGNNFGNSLKSNQTVTKSAVNVDITVTAVSGKTDVYTISYTGATKLNDLAWSVANGTNGKKFFVYGSTTNLLYLAKTNDNNALGIGAGTSNTEWEMGSNGYLLKGYGVTRYCGKYVSGSDWRTYNSETATNYKSSNTQQQLYFYVLQSASSDPVINASNVTLESNVTSGEIAYTISNPVSGVNPTAEIVSGDWISDVVVNTSTNNITFSATANTGTTDRTATIKISYTGANDKVVTITQKKYVADFVTLPFEWKGGSSDDFKAITGVTLSGNGSDYAPSNAPYLIKLDGTGDYFQFKTNSRIGVINIGIKMIGGSTASSIAVTGSADGTNWSNTLETLSISGSSSEELTLTTENALAENYRYVRLTFTKGANVGVGPISIAEYVAPAPRTVTFDGSGKGTPTETSLTEAAVESGVTLPTVNNVTAGYEFLGWTATENGTTVDDGLTAGATYKPKKDIILYAVYGKVDYDIINQIEGATVTIKKNSTDVVKANVGDVITLSAVKDEYVISAWDVKDASNNVVEVTNNQFTMPASNVTINATFVEAAQENTAIYRATLTSNTAATVTGSIGGTATVSLQLDKDKYKFGGTSHYITITLPAGQTFNEGDVLNIHTNIAAQANNNTIALFASNSAKADANVLQSQANFTNLGDNKIILNSAFENLNTLTIARTTTYNWNGYVDYVEVTRQPAILEDPTCTATETSFNPECKADVEMSVTAENYVYLQWYTCDEDGNNPVAIAAANATSYIYTTTAEEEGKTKYFYCAAINPKATNKSVNSEVISVAVKPLPRYTITATLPDGGYYTVNAQKVDADHSSFEALEGANITLTTTADDTHQLHSTPFLVKDADEESLKVSKSGNNYTFTMPAKAVTITAQYVATYSITAGVCTNGSVEVSTSRTSRGSKVTVTPNAAEHYHVSSVYYVKENEETHNAITVTDDVYSFSMVASNVTVYAEFAEDDNVTITWSINGNTDRTSKVYVGEAIVFPTDIADIEGKKFQGWVDESDMYYSNAETAPTYANASEVIASETATYYAIFANVVPGTKTTLTDVLTRETTEVESGSQTYTGWSNKQANDGSNAIYAGQSAGNYNSIQLRSNNSNSGIISTTSGGNVKKVTVDWNDNTASNRTLNVYGSNTAYTAATELYNEATYGTLLGTIVCGTSTELTVIGNYAYIGLCSNSGAMYLTSVSIEWESGAPDQVSNYCTKISESITLTDPTEGYYGFSTFCGSANYTVEGAKAYKAKVENGDLVLTELTGIIPAGNDNYENGVVIAGPRGETVTIHYTTKKADADMDGNQLLGTLAVTSAETLKNGADYLMVFSKSNGGFVSYTGTNVPAYKACLPYSDNAGAPMRMVFGRDNLPTNNVNVNVNDNQGTKVMIDGRLYILRDGKTYDSFGRLVK